jgi:hypothetical protein
MSGSQYGNTPSRARVSQPTDGEDRGIPCIDDEGAVTGARQLHKGRRLPVVDVVPSTRA